MVTALQTDRRQSTEEAFASLQARQEKASQSHVIDKTQINTELTIDERRALTDEKLNYLLQTSDGALLLSVIKEAKDRDDGKPMQRIDAKLTTRSVHLHVALMQDKNATHKILIENDSQKLSD